MHSMYGLYVLHMTDFVFVRLQQANIVLIYINVAAPILAVSAFDTWPSAQTLPSAWLR